MPPRFFPKTRLLRALKPGEAVPVPELATRLPEFRWQELFVTVRTLDRLGAIRLDRRGYEFFVSLLPAGPRSSVAASCGHSR